MHAHAVANGLAGFGPAQTSAAQRFLTGIQSTEGRLLVTGGILVVTLGLVVLVVPWLARLLGGGESGEADRTIEVIRDGVEVLFTRGLQFGILVAGAVALLVVWDRVDEVYGLLQQGGQPVKIVGNVIITALVVLVAYVAVDVLDESIARLSDGADRITDHQEEIIRRVGQLSIMALTIMTALTIWGADLSGLLVGAGFLGIVVGLAARQTLGSLIAGFVLMFSRPFTIGDWVEIGDQEGIVTDITIVNTRLENFDGEFVVLPNDMVGNKPITNRSQKGHLRIRLDVGVDYDSDPDFASEVALEAMRDVEAIEQTPPPQAFLKEFGDSAILIELRFWIDRPTPPRKWQATNAVIDAVKTAFEAQDIKIPFPQRELTGRGETGGFQVRSASAEPAEAGVRGAGQPPESSAPARTDGETAAKADGNAPDDGDSADGIRDSGDAGNGVDTDGEGSGNGDAED